MRELDLSTIDQPTMAITLPGADKKRLVLTTPTVKCIERLKTMAPTLRSLLKNKGENGLDAAFTLAADLMSCNTGSEKITAANLKTQYGITIQHLFAFYAGYMEFINEVNSAKN